MLADAEGERCPGQDLKNSSGEREEFKVGAENRKRSLNRHRGFIVLPTNLTQCQISTV